MKKKLNTADRGLRTFFLYTLIVAFIIFIALSIKAFFILQNSKFDGKNINVSIIQNNKMVAIAGYNKEANLISYVDIKDSNIPADKSLANIGLIYDAKITSNSNLSDENAESILLKSIFNTGSLRTDLTLFDLAQLLYFSKTIPEKNIRREIITVKEKEVPVDKIRELFKNNSILSENISIQIINATEQAGLGIRLEQALNSVGANVVAVSTSRNKESQSRIKYFGNDSYTLKKLKKLLKYPSESLKEKSFADIIIIIGEDYKNTSVF